MDSNKINILSASNLSVGYAQDKARKNIVFSGINLSAVTGELIALAGRNGAGKSTLLKTLAKLQEPINGHITIEGKDIHDFKRKEFAFEMGYVSTEAILVSHLKVADVVSLGRFPYTNFIGKIGATDRQKIDEAIHLTNIEHLVDKNLNEISDGERQKVMIARTLAQDTRIIILDEPTSFLDLPNKYEIIGILKYLAAVKGKTVIFSCHDVHIAMQQADKMWLMLGNRFVEGAPEDLILNTSFEELFVNHKMNFDSNTGEFKIQQEETGNIQLSGEGKPYFWTKNALRRLNYAITNNESVFKIDVIEENGQLSWVLKNSSQKFTFFSIYSLSLYLKSDNLC